MSIKILEDNGEIRARDTNLGVIQSIVQDSVFSSSLPGEELSASFYHPLAQALENLVEGF